jgi:hypothetical protein
MMRSLAVSLLLALAACSSPSAGPEPSLAPRPAEAIDPRVPIPADIPPGTVNPVLARRLDELVAEARAGELAFQAREAEASRLAAGAGPEASEGWVAAQQALSRLVEQYGVTTRAAADIDALAATQLESKRWISPADQAAINAAANAVATVGEPQAAAIARIRDGIAR